VSDEQEHRSGPPQDVSTQNREEAGTGNQGQAGGLQPDGEGGGRGDPAGAARDGDPAGTREAGERPGGERPGQRGASEGRPGGAGEGSQATGHPQNAG
jgi:hypothetical protein